MARSQSQMIRAAAVVDDPNLVASLPYLNFLRFLKRNFFRNTDLRRLLQVGLVRWSALSDAKKRLFEPEVRYYPHHTVDLCCIPFPSESWPVWRAGREIGDAADCFAVLGMARKDVVQCDGPSTTSVLHRNAEDPSGQQGKQCKIRLQ
ncbi:uncharacterized protein LOC6545471 isoform X1 [Drosophila erecta]|uniref:uncharacterized protein LOC6545471 isoform X1 n=1 Tax=Drosophila erecta TaxID=7220 RepID=UPI000F05B3F6|nr:uncharacterized protein LOC6545471 isoform X1 [Drosophila erecta]